MSTVTQTLHREDGLSLVELMVAVLLFTIVAVVFTAVLQSSLTATEDLAGAARSNDDVRLVLARIDREFRGAERVCEPDPGTTSDRFEFRTRAYAGATPPASGYRDVVYELRDPDGDGQFTHLQRSQDGAGWITVIDGVLNKSIVDDEYNTAEGRPLGTAGVPLATNQGGTGTGAPSEGKVITVRIWVDDDPNDRVGARLATTEVSGRNIWTPNAAGC